MSDEFSEIMQTAEDSVRPDRPVMSYPPRQVASSKFIREVKHALDIADDDFWAMSTAEGRERRLRQEPGVHIHQEFAAITRRVRAQITESADRALIRIGVDPEMERRVERLDKEIAKVRVGIEILTAAFGGLGGVFEAVTEQVDALATAIGANA